MNVRDLSTRFLDSLSTRAGLSGAQPKFKSPALSRCPVGALQLLGDHEAELALDGGRQAELLDAEHARADHRVVQVREGEAVVPLEEQHAVLVWMGSGCPLADDPSSDPVW